MTPKKIEQMAHDLITGKIEMGEPVDMQWAVNELISSQGTITGGGVDFYTICARDFVYRVVKKAVGKYAQPEGNDQLLLDGFDHLQSAYTVTREAGTTLVPIGLLSDNELLDRAQELRGIAAGTIAHAEEIEGFVRDRQAGSRSA